MKIWKYYNFLVIQNNILLLFCFMNNYQNNNLFQKQISYEYSFFLSSFSCIIALFSKLEKTLSQFFSFSYGVPFVAEILTMRYFNDLSDSNFNNCHLLVSIYVRQNVKIFRIQVIITHPLQYNQRDFEILYTEMRDSSILLFGIGKALL